MGAERLGLREIRRAVDAAERDHRQAGFPGEQLEAERPQHARRDASGVG